MSHRKYPTIQPTSIRLPNQLRRRLEKHAAKEDRYLSVFIIRLLEQEMDRRERALPKFPTAQFEDPEEGTL